MTMKKQDIAALPCIHRSRSASIHLWQDSVYGGPAVVKTIGQDTFPANADKRLANEYALTQDLHIQGVRKTYDLLDIDGSPALIMEYVAGETLQKAFVGERRPVAATLAMAASVSRVLDELHQSKHIHRNIDSTNILADPDRQTATLIDFGNAVTIDPKARPPEFPDLSETSLHYIAPEQTGRINRPVDHRADLYSLGVVLYEMLSGRLPFATDNVPELIHCHLAKNPRPVCEIDHRVPRVVSDIVMKLMAKNPDDRYQSASGLKTDLEQCLRQLQEGNGIKAFALAGDDVSAIFHIPKKLYGRERELRVLREAIDEAGRGGSGVLLITGSEGTGKTSLVGEVRHHVARCGGYFIAGSYDERQKNVPYHALIQAISGLIDLMLTENAGQVAQWTEKLQKVLVDSGPLPTLMIPRLALVIGKNPLVQEMAPVERQNRFYNAMQSIIGTIAQERHPLVLFLDNLQWADYASLDLLKLMAEGAEIPNVLFIGAYRDTEIGPVHPLTETLDSLRHGKRIESPLHLENLSRTALNNLIADTLRSEPTYVQALSDLVFEKTGGNALFAVQFFQSLHDEGLLSFIGYLKHWEWSTEQIRALAITDNVVALMTRKIGKLPAETQQLLALAACLGSSFDLDNLAVIAGQTIDETDAALAMAVEEGLVLPVDQFNQAETARHPQRLTFLHDRVRQVSYSLISRKQKRSAHLQIGRMLGQGLRESEVEEKIFAITDHMNEGFQYLDGEEEKMKLIRFNLIAGGKAKRAAAYRAAIWYLSMGIGMLPADKWQRCYDLATSLYLEAVEAEYLSTNFERAEFLSTELLRYAEDLLLKIKVYEFRMLIYTARNQNEQALESGREALDLLDVNLPAHPEDARAYAEAIRSELTDEIGRVGDLTALPVLHDEHQLAVRRILMNMAGSAHRSRPELLPAIILKAVLLSVKHGNSPMSACAYGWYAVLFCGPYKDLEQCALFGRLSLAVLRQFKASKIEIRVLVLYNVLIRPWQEHVGGIVKALQEVYRQGVATGELEYTYYAALHSCGYLFCAGGSLPYIGRTLTEHIETTDRFRLEFHSDFGRIWAQTAQNIFGLPADPCRLSGELLDEAKMLPVWIERNEPVLVFNTLCCKTMLQYLFGNYKEAVDSARLAEKYEEGGVGYLYHAQYFFYFALALLAHYPQADTRARQESLDKVAEIQARMRVWADNAPMNFQHKYELIEAEKARISGDRLKAIECYGRAIQGAGEHGYLHEEALAYEREAQFYIAFGREDLAGFDMAKAVEGYRLWGAVRKIEDLQERYRHLLGPDKPLQLDSAAIINALHLLSREIRLDQLLDRMMHLVMENAGAEKGILIENREGRLTIQAKGEVGRDHIETMQGIPVGEDNEVPLSVVNYVARTQSPVLLNDAFRDSIYAHDGYIAEHRTRSLLCLPLVHQGRLSGLLYLENNLATKVFTPDRLEVLKALSSQAAISMENAGLYASLETTIKGLNQAEAAVRDSQSLLTAIIDNSTAIISVKDLKGHYLLVNRRFEELFHIAGASALGRTDRDLFPAGLAAAFQALDRQVLDKGGAMESEQVVSHDDGPHTYISIKCPLFNNEGKPYAVFGIMTDITERKRVEEALGESERKFRAIFEQTFQFIGLMTTDGVLAAANKAALQLAGVEESDVIGKLFWQTPWWTHSPELQERLEAAVQQAAAGEFVRFEATHPAADGSLRYVDFSLKPVKDETGSVVLLIPEGRDITERKQAEEELKKNRDHLDELVRQRTAEVTEANALLRQEIGERKKIEEALNSRLVALTEPLETTDISFTDLFNIEDMQKIQDALADALNVGSLITNPDGTPITRPSRFCRLCNDIIRKTPKGLSNCVISDSVIGRQNPDGPIIQPCLSGGLWDAGASITLGGKHVANWLIGQVKNEAIDEKNMLRYAAEIGADEDEFRRALQEVPVMSTDQFTKTATLLFRLANELSLKAYQNVQQARFITERKRAEEELVIAKELAETANRAKTTFLSSMSHELRTPLNAILGYAQILLRQKNLTGTQLQQLEIMRSSGEHLLMLINDILDVGRIEAWKIELEEAPFRLPDLLRQVYDIIKIRTDEKDLIFRYEPQTPLPDSVRGDDRKLRQILLNLLGNAVKYTRRGQIVLRVHYDREGPGLFRAEVTDTGIGIPHDKLEAIFEPFTQLVGEGLPHEGTGLGLTITRQLVDLMHGTLGVTSEPGEGSTFHFEMPMPEEVDTGRSEAKNQPVVTGYAGPRKNILVVDDNVANASMLVSLLEPLGFSILAVESGTEALRRARMQIPDLVLIDLVMPDMDGLQTVAEMKRHRKFDATRIIGVSATVTSSPRKEEFVAVCDDFLGKPVILEALLDKMKALLDIEWQTSQQQTSEESAGETADEAPFEVPSPETMVELHDLAMRGDLRGIRNWAAAIEGKDGRYRRFAEKLRELTGRFKTKAVLSLIERYTPEKK